MSQNEQNHKPHQSLFNIIKHKQKLLIVHFDSIDAKLNLEFQPQAIVLKALNQPANSGGLQ